MLLPPSGLRGIPEKKSFLDFSAISLILGRSYIIFVLQSWREDHKGRMTRITGYEDLAALSSGFASICPEKGRTKTGNHVEFKEP